jgi:actinorhodin biosynthesis protein ActVIA
MLSHTEQVAPAQSFADLYADVQQFYAHHMFLLDSGAAAEWADGFTEDGVFAPPSAPEPICGRAKLVEGALATRESLVMAGEQHRHLLFALDVVPNEDGTVAVRSYAQIIATPCGGQPRMHLMCVTYDVLVRVAGELRIKHRRVTRDDRP